MSVARISIMKPEPGRKAELERLLDNLQEFLSTQKGFIMGFRFQGLEDQEEIGRITLWVSQEEANHAAILDHTVSLRSQIHLLIQPGHREMLVEIVGSPKNLPSPPLSRLR